jgi:hypothetical protein
MTYTVTALESTPARLTSRRAVINWHKDDADMLADAWRAMGYIVTVTVEG